MKGHTFNTAHQHLLPRAESTLVWAWRPPYQRAKIVGKDEGIIGCTDVSPRSTLLKIFPQSPEKTWGNQHVRPCGYLGPVVRERRKPFILPSKLSRSLGGPDYKSFVFRPGGLVGNGRYLGFFPSCWVTCCHFGCWADFLRSVSLGCYPVKWMWFQWKNSFLHCMRSLADATN